MPKGSSCLSEAAWHACGRQAAGWRATAATHGCNQVITRRPFEFPRYAGDIPYILDEFGGILCLEVTPEKDKAWGYGKAPATVEEFFERLDGQVSGLLSLDGMCGYCYTQLTDVMQEQNGLFYFDRTPKYDAERLKAIFGRQPLRV